MHRARPSEPHRQGEGPEGVVTVLELELLGADHVVGGAGQSRLRELSQARIIRKSPINVAFSGGNAGPVYTPTSAGCEHLSVYKSDETWLATYTKSPRLDRLFHWLEIAWLHSVVSRACDAAAGSGIECAAAHLRRRLRKRRCVVLDRPGTVKIRRQPPEVTSKKRRNVDAFEEEAAVKRRLGEKNGGNDVESVRHLTVLPPRLRDAS